MGNYRIFVAEDDSIILMGLKMILKHLGHAISYYVDARCRTVAEPVEGGKMRMSSKAFDMAEERGKLKGKNEGMMEKAVETVRNLVRDFNFSVEQACNAANISVDDYEKNNEK